MSQPLRITCPTLADVPAAEILDRLATRQRHVVLHFPTGGKAEECGFDTGAVIAPLRRALPEDLVMFDAGGHRGDRCVTVLRVIGRQAVLALEDRLVAAAAEFRAAAHDLMGRLAAALSIPIARFAAEPMIRFDLGDRDGGALDGGWTFGFHGLECRFQNAGTGQVVEVQLDFAGEFGALDPYFYYLFLASTPAFAPIAAALENPFHDAARALDILAERGRLGKVRSSVGDHESYVALDQPDLSGGTIADSRRPPGAPYNKGTSWST